MRASQRQLGCCWTAPRPGELWVADRHFCTRTVLQGWQAAGASFIVREHGRTGTGQVRELAIELMDQPGAWQRIGLTLDGPTKDGGVTIRL